MRQTRSRLIFTLALGLIAVAAVLLGGDSSRAVQAPFMSLDMVIDGNVYDEASNTMTVGSIETCLTTPAPGDNAQHNHVAHLLLHNVEDLHGWQVRMNYDGGRMRPANINFTPFVDSATGDSISFLNLPEEAGAHRPLVPAQQIPPAVAGPQTAFVGAVYNGVPSLALSPDTPPKAPPDDSSYRAPNGGVLAAITIQVLPGQVGQATLSIDLDDHDPNPPGSTVVVFNGTESSTIPFPENALSDGFHAEGVACAAPPQPTPPTAPPDGDGGDGDGDGVPGTPGASGDGDGDGVGATASPGENGESPGESPGATGRSEGDDDDGNGGGEGDDDDGGAAIWPFIVLGAVAVAVAGGYGGWRYRSRFPWLERWMSRLRRS